MDKVNIQSRLLAENPLALEFTSSLRKGCSVYLGKQEQAREETVNSAGALPSNQGATGCPSFHFSLLGAVHTLAVLDSQCHKHGSNVPASVASEAAAAP